MDEKILIQYRYAEQEKFQKSKKIAYILPIVGVIGILLYFLLEDISFPIAILGGMYGGLILFMGLALIVVFKFQSKVEITVSENRVYGRTMLSEVSLPMDSVTMSHKRGRIVLRVETPSENFEFRFYDQKARDEVYDVINRRIAERNNNKGSVTVVNSTSNADELKKYKDLLDSGIITQEEFNSKKKQLLGL